MIDHLKRRDERWKLILLTLGNECQRCHQSFPIVVYDLHHPKGKKSRKDTPARIVRFATDKVFREHLAQWELFCANCHRLHHAEINNWHPARVIESRGPCVVCGLPLYSSAPRIKSHPGECRTVFRRQKIKEWKQRQRG